MNGILLTDSWAGRRQTPVEILKETPKRYRVRLLESVRRPGRRGWGLIGDVMNVPKSAIRLSTNSPLSKG